MKIIIFLSLLVIFSSAKATNYYFSAVSGEDSRSPVEAKNPWSPWKSLDKLNSIFSNLKPGDSLLLKRGETFYGTIFVKSSGTLHLPIVIAAYGQGNKPVISGFTALTWNPLGDNIYESQVLTPVAIKVVNVNGSLVAMGRFPNEGYLTFESHNGTSSITDNHLTATPNWSGAEMVLRSRRWILDRDLITNHAGNTINYTAASKYEPTDKYGYFIQNSPLTLDRPGEWYYNPSSKKLWLFSEAEPKNVKAATLDNLIKSTGASNIIFSNLVIQGASNAAVSITGGSNINLLYCDILYSGEFAVRLTGHKGLKVENCTIVNSLNNGIDLGENSGYAILRNNLVKNTCTLAGMGKSADQGGIAIRTKSINTLIEYNRIINTGYVPIYLSSDSAVIRNNYIDTFCTIKDDGGGIYSYIGKGIPKVGNKIIGNIIMNGIGAPAGTQNMKQSAATGIYLDDNTTNIEITGNSVSACNNQGIFMQNTSSVVVKDNTFFDNKVQISIIQRPGKMVRNNIISQNIFFSKQPDQTMLFLQSEAGDIDQFAQFENNYYAKPLENKLVVYDTRSIANHTGKPGDELAGWKQKYGIDENKRGASAMAVPASKYPVRFEYNPTNVSKTIALDGNYADLKNNKYPRTLTLEPYASAVLIKQ